MADVATNAAEELESVGDALSRLPRLPREVEGRLVASVERLARLIANDYLAVRGTLEFDDLVATGLLGALHAARRCGETPEFRRCVGNWIRAYIQRSLSNESRTIRIPCWLLTERLRDGEPLAVPIAVQADERVLLGTVASDWPGPEELLAREQETLALQSAIARLPERYREVIELHLAGLTNPEIGGRIGYTGERVRQLLVLALQALGNDLRGDSARTRRHARAPRCNAHPARARGADREAA